MLTDKRKAQLAEGVAARFERLKEHYGAAPYAFAYNSYAVIVKPHETYYGLSIYNGEGQFVTNIAV